MIKDAQINALTSEGGPGVIPCPTLTKERFKCPSFYTLVSIDTLQQFHQRSFFRKVWGWWIVEVVMYCAGASVMFKV